MALLTSEMQRVRFECGTNVLGVGSEPYVSYIAVFNQVILPYLNAGATTTSSTVVSASTSPAQVALALASATGFAAGDTIIVDVDARQERVTIESLSGSSATCLLSLAHSGTYQVTQEGGEAIVRQCLRSIADVKTKIYSAAQNAGIKEVAGAGDSVEWFANSTGKSAQLDSLKDLLMFWRDELCGALGIPNGWRWRGGGGSSYELY